MEKTDKQFIIRLPSHLHKRLKVVASMCGMTMQDITVNAIQRELDVFDNTVPILKNIPGVSEYKKLHSNLSNAVKINENLDNMNDELEQSILDKKINNVDENNVDKIITPNTKDNI